jgi:hypothetical protein
MRSEVLVAVRIKIMVSWDVAPFSLLHEYQRYGDTYCLHFQCKRWIYQPTQYHILEDRKLELFNVPKIK